MLTRFQTLFPVLFLCIWSAGYAVAKLALNYTEPLNLLAYRFVGAFIVLTPLVLFLRLRIPKLSTCYSLMGTGLFLHIGHFGSIYVGMKLGASASIMALFAASQPVLVIISAALFARKMPSWQIWVALCLGLSGAALIIGVDMQHNQGFLLGAMLGFTAVVGMSLGQVIDKHRKIGVHPIMGTWVQYAFASLVSLPIAFYFEGFAATITLPFIASLAYLILGNSILGIMLMLHIVRSGSVSKVASIMFLVPAVGALIAWPVAGEVPRLITIPGFILAMLGAYWTSRLTGTSRLQD
jgi:drug/metabolite transporter (DMT)-like permease